MCEATGNGSWGPNETEWAKLLAQLVVFKEKSGGARLVERGAGRMGEHPGQIREGFKKPARDRKGHENTYAGNTTKRRAARVTLIYINVAKNTYVKQPMPSSSATRRSVVLPA